MKLQIEIDESIIELLEFIKDRNETNLKELCESYVVEGVKGFHPFFHYGIENNVNLIIEGDKIYYPKK